MAQLCRRREELEKVGAQVVFLSFGAPSSALRWLRETRSPFPAWLDLERKAYRLYGLEASLLRSWGPRTVATYVRLMLARRRWRGIQGDSRQLGGDFIVDRQGTIQFAYRSHDPVDRPDVDLLLGVLSGLPQGGPAAPGSAI